MDQILLGLLSSDQPEPIKRQLLLQIADAGAKQQPVAVVKSVLQIAADLSLQSKTLLEVDTGKKIYMSWGKFNRNVLEEFCDRSFLLYLMDGSVQHRANAVWLLHETLILLRGCPNFPNICQMIEAKSTHFATQHPHHEIIIPYCSFLLDMVDCIPKGEYTTKFCVSIIHAVSTFDAPQDKAQLLWYLRDVPGVIGKFLKHVWDHADQGCIMTSLRAIFNIISYIESSGLEPSLALGGIVKYIPTGLIKQVTENVVRDSNIKDNALEQALKRMINWLSWPGAVLVDMWVIALLRGLASVHKYTILIRVTEDMIEKIFDRLRFPVVRDGALNVLYHMLLSFQHSPDVFHKIAPTVPEVFQILQHEKAEGCLKRLTELLHCLIALHPGFPELYDPILDVIHKYPRPSVQFIQSQLAVNKWTAQSGQSTIGHCVHLIPMSVTGKVGLINLGNTCYINSVMQALYMCDSYRNSVISTSPSLKQPLLVKLQYLFAFLSNTQRPAYAPHMYIKVARPPWFEAGQQQDCSEFLKYMLDQLLEQEKSKVRDKGKDPDATRSSAAAATCGPVDIDTLIQKMFGVKVLISNQCLSCKTKSNHTETFLDIPLPFPDKTDSAQKKKLKSSLKETLIGGGSSPGKSKGSPKDKGKLEPSEILFLEDLMKYFLTAEYLQGENQYHCEYCGGKKDAVRTQSIIQTPNYLILTLLRFSFNVKTMSRTKVFTDVRYPRILKVPLSEENDLRNRKAGSTSSYEPDYETFVLNSVIVHSGVSSECGHYYTYARTGIPTCCKSESDIRSNVYDAKWYLFNDSRVTNTTFESFSQVTKRFSQDTAYVLFYQKVGIGRAVTPDKVTSLRKDLQEAVAKDNMLYLQEQEIAARSKSMRNQQSGSHQNYSLWKDWNDKGGPGPPGNCGGGGGLSSGPRYVC